MKKNVSWLKAFGFIEMIISLLVVSVLLIGFYYYTVKQNQLITNQFSKNTGRFDADRLLLSLKRDFREQLGMNPKMTIYSTDPSKANACSDEQRIGLNGAADSELYYTSDLEADGNVSADSDCFHYYLVKSDGSNAGPNPFRGLTNSSSVQKTTDKLCQLPINKQFSEEYTLYKKAKGSNATMVADGLLCLEIAYFTFDSGSGGWQRVDLDLATNALVEDPLELQKIEKVSLGFVQRLPKINRNYVNPLIDPHGKVSVEYQTQYRQFELPLQNPPLKEAVSDSSWPEDFQ